ncbi:MAG TPA: TrmJ/YjtD family RNA methyltransferase [Casimicrobiaceae bacterium]|jgi:tRNA/rRNA methyltransferase|nr:TrmJ/YjtD family RNA methyltransferase [Casimicrobiaceae bacterium]
MLTAALDRTRVVLCATSHPGNIGAAARAMRAMGLSQLVLVAPHAFPHPDADARAAGASELLRAAVVVPTLQEALSGATLAIGFSARPREFAGAARSVRVAAGEAVAHAAVGYVALVFGAEMSGLSNAELAHCQIVATIPGAPGQASLNLAAAVQVAAYELFVAAHGEQVWAAPHFEPATLDEIEALYVRAEHTLVAMRFLDPRQPKRLLARLRRLFARARLEKEEVNILRGILARIDQLLGRLAP